MYLRELPSYPAKVLWGFMMKLSAFMENSKSEFGMCKQHGSGLLFSAVFS